MTTTDVQATSEVKVSGRRRPSHPLRPAWMGRPKLITQVIKTVVLGLAVVAVILPFWAVVATSLADQQTISESGGGMILWTDTPTLDAYIAVLRGGAVTRALAISVGITVVGTFLSLACTAGLAYWTSRPGARGARIMVMIILGALLFSPGLIPNYLLVKELGLIDSWWALILPVMVNAFNVIVMRAFFQGIPQELFESAALDGASSATVLVRIVLPLSKAVLAVVGLFYAVAYWNAFFNALLYIQSTEKWPMALVLRTYVVNQAAVAADDLGAADAIPPQLPLQMAILVIALVPILLVYPFLQKHFASGVMIGAVKG